MVKNADGVKIDINTLERGVCSKISQKQRKRRKPCVEMWEQRRNPMTEAMPPFGALKASMCEDWTASGAEIVRDTDMKWGE